MPEELVQVNATVSTLRPPIDTRCFPALEILSKCTYHVTITFVSSVSSVEGESVLTAVQLLLINIIMDTFAALTLATDITLESLLDRKLDTRRTRPLTADTIKTILGQLMYQAITVLIMLPWPHDPRPQSHGQEQPGGDHARVQHICLRRWFPRLSFLSSLPRELGQPLVYWIRGAAIIVAIFVTVPACFYHYSSPPH